MASFSDLTASMKKLEGRVAVITGGASGIGESTARLFIQHGAKVVIADIQDELGMKLCGELGGAAAYVHCDVREEEQVRAAVDHAVERYGRLDIMFNNAGIGGDAMPSILLSTKEEFERVMSVNLVGAFLGTKHAARHMIPARRGVILGTASMTTAVSGAASHSYTASKHGVVGLTKNAAVELGRYGVRVNCVSPACVATPLSLQYINMGAEEMEEIVRGTANLKGVTLRAEDVARAVLFLASDDANYLSGHNLVLDGGFSLTNPGIDVFSAAAAAALAPPPTSSSA